MQEIEHEVLLWWKKNCVQACISTENSINNVNKSMQREGKHMVHASKIQREINLPKSVPKIIRFVFGCIRVLK